MLTSCHNLFDASESKRTRILRRRGGTETRLETVAAKYINFRASLLITCLVPSHQLIPRFPGLDVWCMNRGYILPGAPHIYFSLGMRIVNYEL